jgi:hypothetical protein
MLQDSNNKNIHAFKGQEGQNHQRSEHWRSPVWPVTCTGLTGADPSEAVSGWPGTCARVTGTLLYAAGWPDPYGRVTRGWPNFQEKGWFGVKGYEGLNTFQLINHLYVVTKLVMSLTKILIE